MSEPTYTCADCRFSLDQGEAMNGAGERVTARICRRYPPLGHIVTMKGSPSIMNPSGTVPVPASYFPPCPGKPNDWCGEYQPSQKGIH